jgi:hypothetical protein
MTQDERFQADSLDRYISARQSGRQPGGPAAIPAGEAELLDELLSLAESAQPSARYVAETGALLCAQSRRAQDGRAQARPTDAARQSPIETLARSLKMKGPMLLPLVGAAAVICLAVVAFAVITRPGMPAAPTGVAGAPTATLQALQPTPLPGAETPGGVATTASSPVPTAVATVVPSMAPAASPTEAPPATPLPLPTAVPILPPLADWMTGGYGGGGGSPPAALEFVLGAPLPAGPAELTAYLQRVPEALTPSSMEAVAARLGLANVTLYQGGVVAWPVDVAFEGPEIYFYSDRSVLPANGAWAYPPHDFPAAGEAIGAAQAFLEGRGLLDVPVRTEVRDDRVRFYQLLDGRWPLYGPLVEVAVRADGAVGLLSYRRLVFDSVGSYPVIPAEDAWAMVVAGEPAGRLWFTLYPAASLNPNVWIRSYVSGQSADVFGPLQVRLPLDPAAPPVVTAGNLVLAGDPAALQALSQAYEDVLRGTGDVEAPVHLWGAVQDAGGYPVLQLAGWEASFSVDPIAGLVDPSGAPYQWSGVIERQGDRGLLLTDEFQPALGGQTFELPDLPAGLAAGTAVYVQGGLINGRIEWSRIQERPAEAGGVPPAAPAAQATVDQVELIYVAPQTTLIAQTAAPAELRVLMPVWSFTGYLDNGMRFQIWVQAVTSEYVR